MPRSSSWLVGAWVDVSDGAPEPTWERIGMVTRHAAPWGGMGYIEAGDCTIFLHGYDERWLHALLSGQSFTFRFTLPGLLLEWNAFADHRRYWGDGEGAQFRLNFFGCPRIIEAAGHWESLRTYYESLVPT